MTAVDLSRELATRVHDEHPAPASFFLGWDHIELWVGNARQAAQFLASAFGFRVTAYAGPETGVMDRASYVLEQGAIRFVVTGTMGPSSDIARHVRAHGDGAHDLAVTVSDATACYEAAIARGAIGLRSPMSVSDEHGSLLIATVATYGETQHTFVQRTTYPEDRFWPGFTDENLPPSPVGPEVGLHMIDH
jgi:4-hydroxyphenylpyruvate dioxygenase